MSAICQASFSFLTFNDEDIAIIKNNNTAKKVLEKGIGISLECRVLLEDPKFRNGKLQIRNWCAGATALCGTYVFCTLLHDGLQRTRNSISCEWNLSSAEFSADELDETSIRFNLTTLEFGRRPPKVPGSSGSEHLPHYFSCECPFKAVHT